MTVIKERPYLSAAVIIIVLTVVSVGIWYTTTQMKTDDTGVISSASSSLSEPTISSPSSSLSKPTISSSVTGYSGPYNQSIVTPNIDCVLSYPDTWGSCNESTNTKSMTATVVTPQSGTGFPCGPLTRTAPCDKDCVVTYGPWEPCNESTNTKSMNGTVTTPQSGTGSSCGPLTRTAPCDKDCVVTYGDWEPCNTSSGLKSRSGTVTTQQSGTGSSCGPLIMTEPCPINCVVEYPQTWGRCSSSGVQTVTGRVVTPQMNGGAECPPLTKSKQCTPGPQYIGCYQDGKNSVRTMNGGGPSLVTTVQECNNAAKAAGSPYFGMQYWQASMKQAPGTTAQCFYGNANTTFAQVTSQGVSNSCVLGSDGVSMLTEGGANAIYEVY